MGRFLESDLILYYEVLRIVLPRTKEIEAVGMESRSKQPAKRDGRRRWYVSQFSSLLCNLQPQPTPKYILYDASANDMNES